MVSSSSDQTDAQTAESDEPTASAPTTSTGKIDRLAGMDTELIFRLIDSILPFEACLYHQILPLTLAGSRLKLGMVNLDDTAALDYVRRILAYMNCSLAPQKLAHEVHQAALTAYLNYSGQKQSARLNTTAQSSIARRIEQRLSQEAARSQTAEPPASDHRHPDASLPAQSHPNHDPNNAPTLLVDTPEELAFQGPDITSPLAQTAIHAETQDTDSLVESFSANGPESDLLQAVTAPPPANLPLASESPPQVPFQTEALPILRVEAKHLSSSIETLATLSPSELLNELMGRVLLGGIGRLYFEQQQQHGRILWSQNGVLQSVLEELPHEQIQGVINELKLLTRLPLIAVQKPKQVEIERLYQKHRLLLRLRVMPGKHGEEATVQVLRGAALKFYQQQQLASLSREALSTAQELQRKVNEIRVRTQSYPMLSADQLSVLPALNDVIKSIEQQLEALKSMQPSELTDED